MIPTLLALLLAAPAPAGELAGHTAGLTVDVGGGLAMGDIPWTPGGGWSLGLGGWWGKGDAGGAIGRHVAVLARWRGELGGTELRNYPGIEVRRGIDLLVLGVRFGGFVAPRLRATTDPLAGTCVAPPCPAMLQGPPLAPGAFVDGLTLRAHAAAAWRFRPPAALVLRLDAGIDVDARPDAEHPVEPVVGLGLAFEITPTLGPRR